MKRVLICALLVTCAFFTVRAERGEAQETDGGCPSVAVTMCERIDLSEVCGPGCYVDIMGKPTDG